MFNWQSSLPTDCTLSYPQSTDFHFPLLLDQVSWSWPPYWLRTMEVRSFTKRPRCECPGEQNDSLLHLNSSGVGILFRRGRHRAQLSLLDNGRGSKRSCSHLLYSHIICRFLWVVSRPGQNGCSVQSQIPRSSGPQGKCKVRDNQGRK
ncbi:unnamed protein product, partial [Dicrocoelium dendriticum]